MTSAPAGPDRRRSALRLPETVVARTEERDAVTRAMEQPGPSNLHVAGPHGSGKTLFTAVALHDTTSATTPCYVPCRRYDTQYQVLAEMTERLTGDSVTSGHRTAHLQRQVASRLQDETVVVVLDDAEFLLQNDGDDLLYFLSRLDDPTTGSIVTVTATEPDLTTVLDTRTASSFQPQQVTVPAYTKAQAAEIFAVHAADLVPQPVTDAAIQWIAEQTTNITLGLHWLARAAEVHDTGALLTADAIVPLRRDALHRYWMHELADFTQHHALVLTVIEQVTAETDRAYTGMVYDRYATLCECRGIRPVTMRQVSTFLDHLELLGLIEVTYYRGGAQGKTRAIRLTSIEQL